MLNLNIMSKHLAIMRKPAIEAILNGTKTIESRFSKRKIPPFGVISVGDLVYIKPPGEEIIGQFKAKKIIFYEGLVEKDLEDIFKEYGRHMEVGDKVEDVRYRQEKKQSFYGTLIFISRSERFITPPVKIKKKDLRGWMVL